jgi:hypothetical protein
VIVSTRPNRFGGVAIHGGNPAINSSIVRQDRRQRPAHAAAEAGCGRGAAS